MNLFALTSATKISQERTIGNGLTLPMTDGETYQITVIKLE